MSSLKGGISSRCVRLTPSFAKKIAFRLSPGSLPWAKMYKEKDIESEKMQFWTGLFLTCTWKSCEGKQQKLYMTTIHAHHETPAPQRSPRVYFGVSSLTLKMEALECISAPLFYAFKLSLNKKTLVVLSIQNRAVKKYKDGSSKLLRLSYLCNPHFMESNLQKSR